MSRLTKAKPKILEQLRNAMLAFKNSVFYLINDAVKTILSTLTV